MARKRTSGKTGAKKAEAAAKSRSARAGGKRVKKSAKKAAKESAGKSAKKSPARSSAKRASRGSKKSLLSRPELREFRKMLLDKRRDIIGDMSGIEAGALGTNLQESSGDLSSMPTHPADIGTDNFEHEFTLGLLESERALLSEINEALARIDKGTYGICVATGEPIGLPRLRARPWAKYCIKYARMVEQGLVRPGEEQAGEELNESVER